MLSIAALPATAAPINKNNADSVIVLDCGPPIGEVVTVRPQPGNGSPASNVVSGEHYVAKQFSFTNEITVQIVGGDSANATFEATVDRGASAPANGRGDLVDCTSSQEFADGPFPIDAEVAELLNADFQTDIFEAGQSVTISGMTTLTILALVPGN